MRVHMTHWCSTDDMNFVNFLEIPLKNEVSLELPPDNEVSFLDFLIGSECPWGDNRYREADVNVY